MDKENLTSTIGFADGLNTLDSAEVLQQSLNFKLDLLDLPGFKGGEALPDTPENSTLGDYKDQLRLLSGNSAPILNRIGSFIENNFPAKTWKQKHRFPEKILHLDRHGQARGLSLPPDRESYKNPYLESFRIHQGVLHNPVSDRRTTKNSFHISEGGFGYIEHSKIQVPQVVFGNMLHHALNPSSRLLELPYTSTQTDKAHCFVSLFLRPLVSPEIQNLSPAQSLEMLFLVPGSLVSNLDFVESIFGNAGDPLLPRNDAMLDVRGFTGHTGCVILAPQLTTLTKKSLGLPHYKNASSRQKKQGMCYKNEKELYNDGNAFKLFFRTDEGRVITLIADNYFGYCKKEVKTQISFAANLSGLCEEEHSGGAFICPSYSLGDTFSEDMYMKKLGMRWKSVVQKYGPAMKLQKEGYGIDKKYSHIHYIPESAHFDLNSQTIEWKKNKKPVQIKLLPGNVYLHPSGYKIHMEKHPGAASWRLVGTVAEGTFCHKPCTVSGGGKSEISKSIEDSQVYRHFYIQDFEKDFKAAGKLLEKNYGNRFRVKWKKKIPSRSVLDPQRSLGSVIKLFTTTDEYTNEYNKWIQSIPRHVFHLVLAIKRHYQPEWGTDWKTHFNVESLDGNAGNELNLDHRKLVSTYLRVGTDNKGNWQLFRLRIDYLPAQKIQMEDDITASLTLPSSSFAHLNKKYSKHSVKLVKNCENRLFQRPDDAKIPGFDNQAEADLASPNTFVSNYQPLNSDEARDLYNNKIVFGSYTEPMKDVIRAGMQNPGKYFICSSHGRLIGGVPSPNVRYLQTNPNLVHPEKMYLAEMALKLRRNIPLSEEVPLPVNSVLIGRRNNAPDKAAGIRSLAVYNPLHYQPLPELFMDFISSLTGKSPSTTGAGSEGPLTKGPFNMLNSMTDLNNALVSYILCEQPVFSTPAGYVGSKYKVEHDLSLLIPEVWSRLSVEERRVKFLMENKMLDKLKDFKWKGKVVRASRLGYRINANFVRANLGRVFVRPLAVFPEDMLKPELQSKAEFADGVLNITEAQIRIAENILADGSIELACPPLKALVHIMARDKYEGMTIDSTRFRDMFTLKKMLASKWYKDRLSNFKDTRIQKFEKQKTYLKEYISQNGNARSLDLQKKLNYTNQQLKKARQPAYLKTLAGTIGMDGLGPSFNGSL